MKISAVAVYLCAPAVACAAGGKNGEGESMTAAVFQMMASLAVVLGIIYLLYYVFSRWFKGVGMGKTRSGHIRVVETRYLAPKRSLMIVEVGGEYLLLGNGSEGVQLIKKLENGDEFGAQNAASPSRPAPEVFRKTFDDLLKKMRGGFSGVKRSDFAINKIWPARDQVEPITVEQMIEQMQPKKSRSVSRPTTKQLKARVIEEIC
jgi:flagellar protein FliO/FliZ